MDTNPRTQHPVILPVYFVIDVSHSMSGDPINAANRILPEVVDAIAQQPILSDKVRIGLIDFSDDARVQLPLCDVLDPALTIPHLSVRGGTSFAAALRLLRTEIDSNIKQLQTDQFFVHRPVVIFISASRSTDANGVWESAFKDLISHKAYPNIMPFGVGEQADPQVLQKLIHPSTGNKQMQMFLSNKGEDALTAITATAEILISSIINTGHSVSQGQSGMVLPPSNQLPNGMSSYTADDDFAPIQPRTSTHLTEEPMDATPGNPETQHAKMLPFYIVVDVSLSMSDEPIKAANAILPEVVDAIAQQPILSDKVRIGLIDFSDDARVQLPLCDVLDSTLTIPHLSVRGRTSFAAALRLLRTEIDSNIKQLKADQYLVHRPAVFFISDGGPTDAKGVWESAFKDLISDKAYPNIVPFGVGEEADPQVLQKLIHPSTGNKQMQMFLSNKGEDAATAITATAEILISSIINTGHSVSQGQSGMVLPQSNQLPSGMSSYTADDDDFPDYV